MSYREREQEEGPDTAFEPCGACGVAQADHGHAFIIKGCLGSLEYCEACLHGRQDAVHVAHDWEPPEDNSPNEPDED